MRFKSLQILNCLNAAVIIAILFILLAQAVPLDMTGDWDVKVYDKNSTTGELTHMDVATWQFFEDSGKFFIVWGSDPIPFWVNGVLNGNQFTAKHKKYSDKLELTFSQDGNSFTGSYRWAIHPNWDPYYVTGMRHIVRPPFNMDSGTRFSSISGEVGVRPHSDETAWKPAKLSMILEVDNHVKTGEDSSCVLSFSDMTTFTMRPESEIILNTPAEKDSKLKLLAGKIWINVKKMIKDGSMDIEMNEAVAGIKGTVLVCEENGGSSTVKVIEGTVSFTSKATGEVVTINAGEMATTTASGLSQPQPFDVKAENAGWEKYTQTSSAGQAGASPGGAVPSAAERPISAGEAHEAPLSPGWDIFDPLSSGKVLWTVLGDGKLQVSFELNGARPNHKYIAGVHFFDPDGKGLPGVCQFDGWKVGCSRDDLTREGRTATCIGAWDFGYLNTNEKGDGMSQFTLVPPRGTYYVQFSVRIGDTCIADKDTSGCGVAYRTEDNFGEGFEAISIG